MDVEDVSTLNVSSPLRHTVTMSEAAEDFDSVVNQNCFDRVRDHPSKLFLSLSNGEAAGGQLPESGKSGSFTELWANNSYFVVNSKKSYYTVGGSDDPACAGKIHLELYPVREQVLRNRLRACQEAATNPKVSVQKRKHFSSEVQKIVGTAIKA